MMSDLCSAASSRSIPRRSAVKLVKSDPGRGGAIICEELRGAKTGRPVTVAGGKKMPSGEAIVTRGVGFLDEVRDEIAWEGVFGAI